MDNALRAGLSFCRIGDRLMFLDLPSDRYFCLAPEAENAFRELVSTDDLRATRSGYLDHLGLLATTTDNGKIEQCRAPPRNGLSLLDSSQRHAIGKLEVVRASIALGLAVTGLRALGLPTMLSSIERRKRHRVPRTPDSEMVVDIVSAFRATRYLFADHDHCLTRSIAVAWRLLAVGAEPDLVLAVKLQPFMAHCWVQVDETLVNDREEVVRDYTPILVV